jgi:hypothetical protein
MLLVLMHGYTAKSVIHVTFGGEDSCSKYSDTDSHVPRGPAKRLERWDLVVRDELPNLAWSLGQTLFNANLGGNVRACATFFPPRTAASPEHSRLRKVEMWGGRALPILMHVLADTY